MPQGCKPKWLSQTEYFRIVCQDLLDQDIKPTASLLEKYDPSFVTRQGTNVTFSHGRLGTIRREELFKAGWRKGENGKWFLPDLPPIGTVVKSKGYQSPIPNTSGLGVIIEVYRRIDVWWDTQYGECKVSLIDAIAQMREEFKDLATADWYAIVANPKDSGEVMAIASFEVEIVQPS